MSVEGIRAPWLLGIGLALAVSGLAQPSRAQLDLGWYTVDGGGLTFSVGGSISLGGTVGQPDAGSMTGGAYTLYGGFWLGGGGVVSGLTEELPPEIELPLAFRVAAGLPNPFRTRTTVQLDLPEQAAVRMLIFDPSGRRVRTMYDGLLSPGRYAIDWNGECDSGRPAAAGIYLMSIQAGRHASHHRLVLLR